MRSVNIDPTPTKPLRMAKTCPMCLQEFYLYSNSPILRSTIDLMVFKKDFQDHIKECFLNGLPNQ